MKIDVLGTKYNVLRVDSGQDSYMKRMGLGGYCDGVEKEIVLLNLKSVPEWKDDPEPRIKKQEHETLRHEIIHAFLNESGLQVSAAVYDEAWPKNEEMVDWIALQFPKIMKVFEEAGCLD